MILALNENSIAMNSFHRIRRRPPPGGLVTPGSPPPHCVDDVAISTSLSVAGRADGCPVLLAPTVGFLF